MEGTTLIFLSHSSRDIEAAEAVCAALEDSGNSCWIATRDIGAGEEWGAAILAAIESSNLMVLVFSTYSTNSPQVRREIAHAARCDLPIRVIRVDSAEPTGSFRLLTIEFMASAEAALPFEDRLAALCSAVSGGAAQAAEAEAVTRKPASDQSGSIRLQALQELLGKVLKANYWIAGIRTLLTAVALIEYFTEHTGRDDARTYVAFSLPLHFAGMAWLLATFAVWLASASHSWLDLRPTVVWRAFFKPLSFMTAPRRIMLELMQKMPGGNQLMAKVQGWWLGVAGTESLSLLMLILAGADDVHPLGLLLPDLLLTMVWFPTAMATGSIVLAVEKLHAAPKES